MGRPAPRKSSLAGRTPVTPPAESAPADPVPQPPAAPAVQERPAADAPSKSKYPPKVSFYQDPADTARVRGAILHTQVAEGTRSLSDFINTAVMAEVRRLEAKYNDGRPFPGVGARGLPPGPPPGMLRPRGRWWATKGIATQPVGWVAISFSGVPAPVGRRGPQDKVSAAG